MGDLVATRRSQGEAPVTRRLAGCDERLAFWVTYMQDAGPSNRHEPCRWFLTQCIPYTLVTPGVSEESPRAVGSGTRALGDSVAA